MLEYIALAVIVAAMVAIFFRNSNEIDEHEEMTIANYDNRSEWDM